MWNDNDWLALSRHAQRCGSRTIHDILLAEPDRAQAFSMQLGPLYFNYARQHVDAEAMADLLARLEASGIGLQTRALFDGEKINRSEKRAVLHTALRSDLSDDPAARDAHQQAQAVLEQIDRVIRDAGFEPARRRQDYSRVEAPGALVA